MRELSAQRETHKDNIASCYEGNDRDVDTREGERRTARQRNREREGREGGEKEERLEFFFLSLLRASRSIRGLPPLFLCEDTT